MKAIVTGMNGTVAPAVASFLRSGGVQIVAWDRSILPIDDLSATSSFLERERPDVFLHVATGPPQWAETVARECGRLQIQFLFTSSVSVFSENGTGPYRPGDQPTATDDYGRYKAECERLVQGANPRAIVARLGWQIGEAPGSNNMIDYLERTAAEAGHIDASAQWYPSCSFLPDTAAALTSLLHRHEPGIYHVNGNKDLNFFIIVSGLNRLHGKRWDVRPGTDPARDDRMLDERVHVAAIDKRLEAAP